MSESPSPFALGHDMTASFLSSEHRIFLRTMMSFALLPRTDDDGVLIGVDWSRTVAESSMERIERYLVATKPPATICCSATLQDELARAVASSPGAWELAVLKSDDTAALAGWVYLRHVHRVRLNRRVSPDELEKEMLSDAERMRLPWPVVGGRPHRG